MKNREVLIQNYIEGYNNFDVEKMTKNLAENIIFQNIENGQLTMNINGIEEFRKQAEIAKMYFSKREQTITSYKHIDNKTEIEIDYFGILAQDFPNGMKKGEEINLKGKSIFEFENNKIIKLTDVS